MFNNNPDFYPTPFALAMRMAGMIDYKYAGKILEPSAGKGDLVEAVNKSLTHRRSSIHCIEQDPNLRALLDGKGFTVVDEDFLQFTGSSQYRTIIMNPPFSNGVTHVLKAWNLMYDGDVIALLNAETLKNPYTKERVLLANIVAEHGTVEYLTEAFTSPETERRTSVDVALIKLSKRANIRDYFDGMDEAQDVSNVGELSSSAELCIPENRIENAVLNFNLAIEKQKRAIIAQAEASHYAYRMLHVNALANDRLDAPHDIDWVLTETNKYVDLLREKAWSNIVNCTEFTKIMSSGVRQEFETQIQRVRKLEFTTLNIRRFLVNLYNSQGEIFEKMLEEVFDWLTMYHKENRIHVEGWKSNDYFFVNKRCVLPRAVSYWTYTPSLDYDFKRKLEDLEKALAYLDGKQAPDLRLNKVVEDCGKIFPYGQRVSSSYLDARFYKKGTGHLFFSDLKLLQKLNLFVGRRRGWLPKSDEQVPQEFWLLNAA